jgi:uncharacterized protein
MKIESILIIVTEKCNLRCKYCYVDKENGVTITDDVIEQLPTFFNDIIVKNNLEYFYINLFGGEATLEWDKFCRIVDKINMVQSLHPNVNISIATTSNLTLLDEEKLIYLRDKDIRISMSLDGGRTTHDRCRVYSNGKGSYDDCLKAIKTYCKVNNVPLRSRIFKSMIAPDNIDYLMDGIRDSINDGFRRTNLSIVRDCEWSDDDLARLEKFYDEYVSFLIEKFNSNEAFNDNGLLLPYNTRREKRMHFCTAGSTILAIAPNGDIYPCQRFFNSRLERTKMGSIFTTIDENHNVANIYKNFTHDISPKCRNCELYKVCYGQCFAAIMEQGKRDICEPIDGVCKALKIFYKASERYINELGYENIAKKFNIQKGKF